MLVKRGRMVIKELVNKPILYKPTIDKMIKNNDGRLVNLDDQYYMRVKDWVIKDSIDFNKERELLKQYLTN